MRRLSHEQRIIDAAEREDASLPDGVDRGDLIYRICLGAQQVLTPAKMATRSGCAANHRLRTGP